MVGNVLSFGCVNGERSLLSYVNDVDNSNTVNGKPSCYWINKSDEAVPLDAGYVALVNCTRMTVQDLNLTNNWQGVLLAYTKDSTVTKNNVASNAVGIDIDHSSNNSICKNSITANSQSGIYVSESSGSHIYHNNMNSARQVQTDGSMNVWDKGYPSGGNYWSDYTGVDSDGDGIGETPYIIDENNRDNYPLTNKRVIFVIPVVPFVGLTALLTMFVALGICAVKARRKGVEIRQ